MKVLLHLNTYYIQNLKNTVKLKFIQLAFIFMLPEKTLFFKCPRDYTLYNFTVFT